MVNIVIKSNMQEAIKLLDNVRRKQIPFAMSQALNDTAFDVRAATLQQSEIVFNNRKRWQNNKRTGFQVIKAHKKQGNAMQSAVLVGAYFANIQEEGGVKRPLGRKLAVPTSSTPKNLRRSDGVRRAKDKNKVFINRKGVFERGGKKGRTKLKMLFSFSSSATIPKRFGFEKTALMKAEARLGWHYRNRLEQAVRTAK